MAESESTAPPADGAAFEFQGKSYFLPRLTQGDRKKFHAVCNAWALRDARDMEPLVKSGDLSAEEFQAAYSLAHGRATSGYYWWDEPGGIFRRGSEEGFVRLCLICFQRVAPKTTEDDVRAMANVVNRDTGRTLLDEQYTLANADPMAPRPTAAGGGGSATDGCNGATASARGKLTV